MRTVSGTITTAERGRVLVPRHSAIAERRLLAFGSPTITVNASLDITRPISVIAHPSNANVAYGLYGYSGGSLYIKVLNPATGSDWAMTSTSATSLETSGTSHCVKPSLVNDSGAIYVYTAQFSGSIVTIRRAAVSSTSNPPTASLSTYTSFTAPFSATTTSSIFRRVEAVIGLSGGQAIVVLGVHDFDNDSSTLYFYWVQSPTKTVPLSTTIKTSFSDTWVANNFWQHATGCAFICANRRPDGTIVVIANAGTYSEPRAIGFTIRNGVESPFRPLVPSDIESGAVNILPTGLTEINSLLYLSGRVVRRPAVRAGSANAVSYDGYMVSTGDLDFSFGARNHYVQSTLANGTVFLPYNATTVFYGGGQSISSAQATSVQTGSVVNGLALPIASWNLSSVVNGSDAVTFSAANPLGALNDDLRIDAGSAIKLQSGQGVDLADIGEYGIDGNTFANGLNGREKVSIETRDAGHKTLIDWVSPFYGQLLARQVVRTNNLAGFTVMTPDKGYKGGTALTYKGLNEPFIAYASAYGSDQHLQKATVTFNYAEPTANYHLSAFGFVFGATDSGNANIAFIPKQNSWTATSGGNMTQIEVRKLALNAIDSLDPNKENTGFNFTPRINNMLRGESGSSIRTTAGTGTYSYRVTPAFAADVQYDFAMRKAGRKVWLYGKTRNYNPANLSANAGYTLLGEYEFAISESPQYSARTSVGVSLNTDVAFSTSWWTQGAFNDIKVQATAAANHLYTLYNRLYMTGDSGSPGPSSTITRTSGVATSGLQTGMTVRVQRRSGGVGHTLYTVNTVTGTDASFYVYRSAIPATFYPDGSNFIHDIYVLQGGLGGFGEVASGNKVDTIQAFNGTFLVPIETGARKREITSAYRAFVVTNDSTAGAVRYIKTDGISHECISGSTYTGGTYEAWDYPTSPHIDPRQWRVLGYGGRIYEGSMATFGLPTGENDVRLLKVEDEAVRYQLQQFLGVGIYPADTQTLTSWTCIPAYYAPLQAATAGSVNLKNWRATSGQQPGDNLGDFTSTPVGGSVKSPIGLLAEVVTRNNDQEAGGVERAYHVVSSTMVQPADVTTTNTSYVTLDNAFSNAIRGADPTGSTVIDGDLVVLSGRGHKLDGVFTSKTTHAENTPVVYLPTNGYPNYNQAAITMSRYGYWGGRYLSIQDAIARVSKMAGMMKPVFRSVASVTGQSITSSAYNVPLRETVSDFVLDANIYIPGGNISTTPADSNRLYITFRGYYTLSIQGWNTSAMVNNGCEGGLRIGLLTNSGSVTADGNGDKWIEHAPVITGNYNLSGTYAGSGISWTLTNDTARTTKVRLIVIGSEVSVEIEGQPAWTFDLSTANDGGSNSYAVYDRGAVTVRYSASLTTTADINVQELSDEATDVFINKGADGSSALNDLIKERHVQHRATTNGGIEFSQFYARDNAGTLQYNLLHDAWGFKDMSVFSHQEVIGQSSGEYIDDATARAEGYSFNTASSNSAKTGANAEIEARLLVRQGKEMAAQRAVSGYGFIELQPEDQVTLIYAGAGDVPGITSGTYVITTMSLSATNASVKGEYVLRQYIASV